MPKLNDTQTILLSTASQRDDLSLYPLPGRYGAGGARVSKALAGLLACGFVEERETDSTALTARTDGDLSYGIFATIAGMTAIGVEEGAPPGKDTRPAAAPAPTPVISKSALVVELMSRPAGATMAELTAATGWLPHTTRAALTGLRKKGHAIERGKRDTATCYSIARAA